jgi:hypothetical protein
MEDQRARPAEIVSPSVNEGSDKPRQARNARRNAREARELPVKNGHALSLKRPIQKPARPLEFATYCFAVKFRTYKNIDLTVSEIVSFVAALGACLSGAEAVVAFSIAT